MAANRSQMIIWAERYPALACLSYSKTVFDQKAVSDLSQLNAFSSEQRSGESRNTCTGGEYYKVTVATIFFFDPHDFVKPAFCGFITEAQ
jgi:hypothetical protein